jgi:ribosomal protein S18 acetylase RimI-like enzyme
MTSASEAASAPVGTFWMRHLDEPLPDVGLLSELTAFERVGPKAAVLLAQAMDLTDAAPVLQRFARGRRCYIARVAGALASYGWVSFDEEGIGELGVRLRLAPGEAYIWDCATFPAYRGQRIYPTLLGWILRDLRAEGLCRVWIGADSDNLASQKGMILAGFQPVVDVFLPDAPSIAQPWVQARPGVPEQIAQDIRQMLSGATSEPS